MKKQTVLLFAFCFCIFVTNHTFAQNVNKQRLPGISETIQRHEIVIPDVDGFKVLKCDFHMHTVFSDGDVWPTVRVRESWEEGLDAIAITDHLEYRPYAKYFNCDFNTSYDIALPKADELGLLLIRGTEITREQGVIGHFNALFIDDCNTVIADDPEESIKNALKQDAFILFNHPGWRMDTCVLSPFQKRIMDKGMVHGIEVVNHMEFYPRVISWCIDWNYPMFANTDQHGMIQEQYPGHRVMTLVLAKERSIPSIKEALFAKRTIAFFNNSFAGTEEVLQHLFLSCVSLENGHQLCNHSGLPFRFTIGKKVFALEPFSTINIPDWRPKKDQSSTSQSPKKLTLLNMWCYEDRHPVVEM